MRLRLPQKMCTALDIDFKIPLASVDAAVEFEPWLNENNGKCTWYLK